MVGRGHESSAHLGRNHERQHPRHAGFPAGQADRRVERPRHPHRDLPLPGGPGLAYRAISGQAPSPLCGLGWKSLGLLELSVLPSIDESAWVPTVRETDALLVWGGDPLFLATWMRRSGLADLLPTLPAEAVYVGVSAGSIATAATFVETYTRPPRGKDKPLKSEDIVFTTPAGDVHRTLVTAQGAGLVDFAVIPHLEHPTTPTLRSRTPSSGRPGFPRRRTRSTTSRPSASSTVSPRSSPRATGGCSSPDPAAAPAARSLR